MHNCNYYCTPPVHAYKLLAEPTITQEIILEKYTRQGRVVIDIIPAREADIATWQKVCTLSVETGKRYQQASVEATTPWLVFILESVSFNGQGAKR